MPFLSERPSTGATGRTLCFSDSTAMGLVARSTREVVMAIPDGALLEFLSGAVHNRCQRQGGSARRPLQLWAHAHPRRRPTPVLDASPGRHQPAPVNDRPPRGSWRYRGMMPTPTRLTQRGSQWSSRHPVGAYVVGNFIPSSILRGTVRQSRGTLSKCGPECVDRDHGSEQGGKLSDGGTDRMGRIIIRPALLTERYAL